MITLTRVPLTRLESLAELKQHPGQYANDAADMILDDTPRLSFHAIHSDGALVGMFKLDPLYFQRHPFATDTDLGLRGVLIDHKLQGKGLGTEAMQALPAHAAAIYPEMRHIVLTVNLTNPAAYKVYKKAGFCDRNEIFTGGTRGPQHILWAELPVFEKAETACSAKSFTSSSP
ncbi:GNAT family N-acetyltransferase [Paracoccus sp. SCSIO 75233]|uniref:GNAT family N-acetyltransferase n=1 Tax=Paracoccus sp. SCSIO 75233 TaxID=3017782 RepID=UPI0022F141E9|nr:GNAT family protein [Paracoccus sp. SCSIO 75233]WBU52502.1 GNAT family protein [Paracoccus sp. SCSIO 75233]